VVAELAAHLLLKLAQVPGDFTSEAVGHGSLLEVIAAGVGGDDETGGNGQAKVGHLGKVGALAA
jgi:hypothetical protein